MVIALFAGDAIVIQRIKEAEGIFIPSIVLGELYYGARKSRRVEENLALIDEFAARNVVLSCGSETARWYGEVKHTLQQKGHPIPENDIWIAAMALQNHLPLVARDAHFKEVKGLSVETW